MEKSDGRHREASPQIHGDTAERAGATWTRTYDPTTQTHTVTFDACSYTATAIALANAGPGGVNGMGAEFGNGPISQQIGGLAPPVWLSDEVYSPYPPIEAAGIKVGEIIGWRVWIDDGKGLQSCVAHCLWPPDHRVEATGVGPGFGEGIHAFKTQEQAELYVGSYQISQPAVLGQVAMWGEVIEFEGGWRAEFARVHSLDTYFTSELVSLGGDRLAELRKLYGFA